MRNVFAFCFLLVALPSFSQLKRSKLEMNRAVTEKYVSMNFFSIAEPQFALGPSFGHRFSERSEYFMEAAYVAKTPFYNWRDIDRLRGARFIVQYRYHFLQQWRPLINFGQAKRNMRARHHPFMGFEFRAKPISFSTKGNFVNGTINDTLTSYSFSANAFTYGGALIFGNTFDLSADGKWKLELTAGIGAKQRNVKLKTVPAGYKTLVVERIAFQVPPLYEETGTVLIPFAIRLRYVLD